MSRRDRKDDGVRGFTLIEAAFLIIVIGLVLVPQFSYLNRQMTQSRARAEEESSREILTALAAYVKRNGFYPCPAPRNLNYDSAAFGRAVVPNGVPQCAGLPNAPGPAGGTVAFGEAPVKDLGLPYTMAANRDGWRYIYAVSENLTTLNGYTASNGQGRIQVNDAVGNNILGPGIYAPFVLVDTGQDGKGASKSLYAGANNFLPCGNANLDSENCDDDAVFIDAPHNDNTIPPNAFYDDTISYTLARQESTLWATSRNAGAGGDLNISARNTGNVGIGADAANPPLDKLHVRGGDVRVMTNGATGGDAQADRDIKADKDVTAGNDVEADSDNDGVGELKAPVLYYDP